MQPQPSAACSFTAHDLNGFLQASAYGVNSDVFNCYFQPEVRPPRCNVCSRLIGEHPAASATGTSQADPSPLNGTPPTLTTTPEGCDVCERVEGWGWICIALVFGFVGLMIFAWLPANFVKGKGFKYAMSGGVLCAVSLCFLLLPCKITIKFHRRSRRVEHSRRRLIWCVASTTSMTFDDVHGVDASPTGVMVNRRAEYRIVLLTSQGQLVLETTPYAAGRAERWRRYHPCPT